MTWNKLGIFGSAFVLTLLVSSCARAPLKSPEQAMRRASGPMLQPMLQDDLPLEPLLLSIETEIAWIESNRREAHPFRFGDRVISSEDYLKGLRRFVELGRSPNGTAEFFKSVSQEFDFYEVYGPDDHGSWGDVFISSYYEPKILGSRKKNKLFSQALYAAPAELLSLDLSSFDPKFEGERSLRGRVEGGAFVPYFSRHEIDVDGKLKDRGLEICYVDPLDAFMAQVQGSVIVTLDDGSSLQLHYSDKNGWKYESIGKFLKDQIPMDKMSMQTIRDYLKSLPDEQAQAVLDRNPSYVFFKRSDLEAPTYLGVPATDGRTIATDRRFFPKGALAFVISEKPDFQDPKAIGWKPFSRFVLDQDIGGAIQGGGRVDLFWGKGDEAEKSAGVMKRMGKLYYLVPKAKPAEIKSGG